MLPRLRIIDNGELKKLHESSLQILERTGMMVDHEGALSLLADVGCRVDLAGKRVRFPPDLVMEQVKLVPKQVILGGRSPEHDLLLGGGTAYPKTRPALGIEQMLDHRTNQARPSTMEDLKEWTIIADALPCIDYNAVLSPVDVHLPSRDISSAALAIRYTVKHLHALAYSGAGVHYLARIAKIVAGSDEEARRRPPISFFQVCISPLYVTNRGVECILAAGETGVPLFLNSSPMMGATAPISIVGCVALLNAEILGMNVIHQLAHPGSPMVYTIRPSAMDMRTMISCWGTMEVSLTAAVCVQLAKEVYGFITDTYGPSTESKSLDTQAAMERTWMAFMPALAGADIVCGAGNLESQYTMSLPQLVLDNELFGSIKRMLQGIQVNDDDGAIEVIEEVGPTGNFLGTDHTFKRFRQASRPAELFDRNLRGNWEKQGRPDVLTKAHQKIDRILKEHQAPPLREEQLRQIQELVTEASATLTTFES